MKLPELKVEHGRLHGIDDGHDNEYTFAIMPEGWAEELASRSNLFPKLVEALEDCLSDADALLRASDSDYARPDEGIVANGKAVLADIRQSEQEGGEHGD